MSYNNNYPVNGFTVNVTLNWLLKEFFSADMQHLKNYVFRDKLAQIIKSIEGLEKCFNKMYLITIESLCKV